MQYGELNFYCPYGCRLILCVEISSSLFSLFLLFKSRRTHFKLTLTSALLKAIYLLNGARDFLKTQYLFSWSVEFKCPLPYLLKVQSPFYPEQFNAVRNFTYDFFMTHFNVIFASMHLSLHWCLLFVYEATVFFHFPQPCYINIKGHLLFSKPELTEPS
jgi:hypothetical protein